MLLPVISGFVNAPIGAAALSSITGFGTGVATALAVNVGSAGAFVVFTGALGTPSSGVLTSCTGLPISTGLTGAGTGILTALGVNTGSAGAPVLFNGALGTPTSGVGTNITGVNAATLGGATFAAPGAIGGGTPSTGAFTTLTATTLNGNTFTTGTYTLTGTAGKTLTFSNTLTLAGTDSTTMTFPSTSATMARTDAAQTFTGTQTFGAITATGITSSPISGSTGSFSTLAASGATTVTSNTAITGGSTGAFQVTGGIYSGNFVYANAGLVAGLWNTSDAGGSLITAINGNSTPSLRIIRSGVGKTDFTWQGTSGTRRLDIIDTDNSVTPLSLNMSGTGAVTFAGPVAGVTTLGCAAITTSGVPRFNGTNTTGAGVTAVGTNCPAVTPTAPYTWIQVTTSDGSTGYIPVWK